MVALLARATQSVLTHRKKTVSSYFTGLELVVLKTPIWILRKIIATVGDDVRREFCKLEVSVPKSC